MVVVGVVAGAVLAGCGASPRATTPTTTEPPLSVPTTSNTSPPPPTTTAPPTTAVPPTTTSVVADATTADPNVLAQQLQAVLDRYVDLYTLSRSDPNRPFTDQALLDSIRDVATVDFIGTFLVPKWTQYRIEGTAARRGPTAVRALVETSLSVVGPDEVQTVFCGFDDGVTFRATDGTVVDDTIVVQHGTIRFLEGDAHWRIDQLSLSSTEPADSSSQIRCQDESG
jgi:hypothetical protein